MRSGSIAWLLEMSGLEVLRLSGGYKNFRNHVLKSFQSKQTLLVLGGKTGSGKTIVLEELNKLGASVLNLEKLAHHKGSAFGAIGEKPQPTQEQFENEVFAQLKSFKNNKPVWLEDESRLIGKNIIPLGLWEQMRDSPIVYLEIPVEERANYLVEEYGKYGKDALVASIEKIKARLGSEQAKESIDAVNNNDLKTACINTLRYYDKTYLHGLNKRENKNVFKLDFEVFDLNTICKTLLEKEKEIYERI
jgi:tRNA 2-selenouridine synthase